VHHPGGELGDDLNMAVEEHPVPGLWVIAVAERVPAVVGPGVLDHRDNLG
jgi:hypothetical protein